MHHLGTTTWLNFRRISNGNWCHDNIVLMGDAAHITHFTIGTGTKLAIENAIGLAEKLHDHKDLQAALKASEEERRVSLLALQSAARNSARWFENVQRHIDQEAINFAFFLTSDAPPGGNGSCKDSVALPASLGRPGDCGAEEVADQIVALDPFRPQRGSCWSIKLTG